MKRTIGLLFALAVSADAAGASAGTGIADDQEINHGLFVIAVADKIRTDCDGIDARLWTAYRFIEKLKSTARARGYTRAEVEAYLDDTQAKMRMNTLRNAYFAEHGAGDLVPERLCVLGRDEIARKSEIGHLLQAK